MDMYTCLSLRVYAGKWCEDCYCLLSLCTFVCTIIAFYAAVYLSREICSIMPNQNWDSVYKIMVRNLIPGYYNWFFLKTVDVYKSEVFKYMAKIIIPNKTTDGRNELIALREVVWGRWCGWQSLTSRHSLCNPLPTGWVSSSGPSPLASWGPHCSGRSASLKVKKHV